MPKTPPWSAADVPDQSGRVALVTGANTGLGFETARMLAAKDGEVILACRNLEKGQDAVRRIQAQQPRAKVSLESLDLADLESVRALADRMLASQKALHLLINNAGVMVPPFSRTKQGFELQFGTNHLGHFALTARLMPRLSATTGARIVVVSSLAHLMGRIDFADPNWHHRPYRRWPAYAQSKLANLMFVLELDRRLKKAGLGVSVTASHPGYAMTELLRNEPISRFFGTYVAMSPEDGALPTLRAATDPSAESGSYWGPGGLGGVRGAPTPAWIAPHAKNLDVAQKLWELSAELTGVAFDL